MNSVVEINFLCSHNDQKAESSNCKTVYLQQTQVSNVGNTTKIRQENETVLLLSFYLSWFALQSDENLKWRFGMANDTHILKFRTDLRWQ